MIQQDLKSISDQEEIYESRVYPLRPHPKTLAFIGQLLLSRDKEIPSEEEFVQATTSFLYETSLKLLAKRNKDNGKISYLVTIVSMHTRLLVDHVEAIDEATYRQAIETLEAEALSLGLVDPPQVVTTDEWRRYNLLKAADNNQG